MGILARLSTLITSNVNDTIDSLQDPAKEIDQIVRDMEDSARQARVEVAECMAQGQLLSKKVAALSAESTTWEDHAVAAVKAGDDALAKEALKRKADRDADRLETEKALLEHDVYVGQLKAGLTALDARVKDVKLRQGSLRQKARAAKTGGSALSTGTTAFDDFDRMSGKIEAMEVGANLGDELSGNTPEAIAADTKLRALSAKDASDDALAALKKKLGG